MKNKIKIGNLNTRQIEQSPIQQSTPENNNPKSSHQIALIVFLFAILISSGIFVFFRTQKQNKISNQNLTTQPTPTSAITAHTPDFPIKVFGATLNPIPDNSSVKGGFDLCQPDFFDPKVDKFYKIKQRGVPPELYKIQGNEDKTESGSMMIDGWLQEGEWKINLPPPFDVTTYHFGCLGGFSSILDLSKNGTRQALYTHVLHYSFSKDGRLLFLVNDVNDQDNWTIKKRIIDIETKEVSEIPNVECVSQYDGFWQGDRLITYTKNEDEYDYQTNICIWDKSAKLISRLSSTTRWEAASRYVLVEKIGLLPSQPDIFFAYTSKDNNTCSLFLADITKNNSFKSIDILDKRDYPQNYHCALPEVEFNLSELFFDKGVPKYEIKKESGPMGKLLWQSLYRKE